MRDKLTQVKWQALGFDADTEAALMYDLDIGPYHCVVSSVGNGWVACVNRKIIHAQGDYRHAIVYPPPRRGRGQRAAARVHFLLADHLMAYFGTGVRRKKVKV